ncbi:MAG: ribonuclease HIII, partial [Verrucomicrobiae bacterium]|nr:ribonuclease HIII [Verrucomicrobiae bacterium]
RWDVVVIGNEKYNQLQARMGTVNELLGWAHARVIENLLAKVPDCPRAISDQFGSKRLVEQALMERGRKIELVQRHKAESDLAVAAASILARDEFVRRLRQLSQRFGVPLPKGASAAVRTAAVELVRKHGAEVLGKVAKVHFRTAKEVLAEVAS